MTFAAFALMAAPAWAADCPSELKPTDDYKTLSEKIKCLNDRINEIEKRGKGGGEPVAAPSSAPEAAATGPATEWNDYRLEGRSCKDTGKSLICKVTFTAPKNVALAIFMDDTALFDQDGSRTTVSEVSFGRKLPPIGHLSHNYVRLDLSKAVASTAEFEFKKGAGAIQTVSAISFAIHDLSANSFEYGTWKIENVVVKGLPIVK